MIWIWINGVVAFLRLFFLPPSHIIRKIEPSAVCPGCGHKNGSIQSITKDGRMLVEHTCRVCRAQWWEAPVITDFEAMAASSTTVKVSAATAEAPKE